MVESLFAAPFADFKPEAQERARFLLGIAVLPLLLLVFNALGLRLVRHAWGTHRPLGWLLALASLGLVGSGVALIRNAPFFWQGSLPAQQPILGVLTVSLLAMGLLWAGKAYGRTLPRGIYLAASAAISLPVAGYYLISAAAIQDSPIYGYHFNAVFHSVVQVFLGKGLLVDFTNQYGLYPHFLKPLFHLTGLSVFTFSLAMAALALLSFAALSLLLERLLSSKVLAFATLAAIIFFASVFSLLIIPEDRYYQYVPLRFVFPSVGLLVAWLYLSAGGKQKSRLAYWSMHLLCSIGVLWNLDTGLVLFLTWMLLLAYLECFQGSLKDKALGILKQVAITMAVLAGVVSLFAGALSLRHGGSPNILANLAYQGIFYGYGFAMLPMPLFHPWMLVALSYLIGLGTAVQALLTAGSDRPRAAMTLFISVLGIGLFSYYQGRSHDFNLVHVLYPALLLWAMGLDALQRIPARGPRTSFAMARGIARVSLSALIVIPGASMLTSLPRIAEVLSNQWRSRAEESAVNRRADRLAAQLASHESAVMLSYHSGLYHLRSRTANPLRLPGMSELLLQSDHRKLEEFLRTNRDVPVVLDKTLKLYGYGPAVAEHTRTLYALYEPNTADARSDAMVLRRRPKAITAPPRADGWLGGSSAKALQGELDATWPYFLVGRGHEGSDLLPIGQALPSPPTSGGAFTVELLINPARGQVAYATLISTHPGSGNFAGFVAHHEGDSESDYSFGYGNGEHWEPSLPFSLTPETWNYLAVVCEGMRVRLYVNGRETGSLQTSKAMKESDLPLTVGDWIHQGRAFNGQIKAFAITAEPTSAEAIAARWHQLQRRLESTANR